MKTAQGMPTITQRSFTTSTTEHQLFEPVLRSDSTGHPVRCNVVEVPSRPSELASRFYAVRGCAHAPPAPSCKQTHASSTSCNQSPRQCLVHTLVSVINT